MTKREFLDRDIRLNNTVTTRIEKYYDIKEHHKHEEHTCVVDYGYSVDAEGRYISDWTTEEDADMLDMLGDIFNV